MAESITSQFRGAQVLITGGMGFIGSNLAHRCLDLGASVTIYDCMDPRSGGNPENIADIRDHVVLCINDIRNFEPLAAAISTADYVFNCAAYTSHPNSMKDPLTDIDVNCKGVIHLLEAARRFRPEARIVHVGTSTQIGRMQKSPIDESHAEFPVDIYSANKSASEKYVLIYAHFYKLHACVVRLANVYGPRSQIMSPDFGFINFFIGLALQEKDLTIFGAGRQLRNVTFVDDAVDALVAAACYRGTDGRAIFAVSNDHLSVADIAEAITRNLGTGRVRYVDWPTNREAIEIGDAVVSNSAALSLLDWQPRVNLSEGLARTKRYYADRLEKYLR